MTTVTHARALLQSGRVQEAEEAYARLLEATPDDAEALNVMALAALRRHEPGQALTLLERAVAAHPDDAHSRFHLGRAAEAAGDTSRALIGYAAAVKINPGFYVAQLYLGHLLEQGDESAQAIEHYQRALAGAQRQGQWLNSGTTPKNLQPLVEQAVLQVRRHRRAVGAQLLERLSIQYGRSELTRVAKAIRIHFGEETAEYPDPRQHPLYLYFPDLPTSPYLGRELFPWIGDFEAQTGAIRSELRQLLQSDAGRERVFLRDDLELANLRGTEAAPSWNGYYFYRHGQRRDNNCAACPVTTRALERLPLCHVARHGPEVLFSVFTAGTHLLPHRGVTNTRLVCHLPLIVPADCALKVGDEIHAWQEGRGVVFDDTYMHEAWNFSHELRVVIILDVWNPHLTPIEQRAIAEIVPGLASPDPLDSPA